MGARETEFGRLITAMVTPFGKDGAVDYAQAGRLARTLRQNGSDSLVVCGTTGKSPTLTTEEKLRLFRTVKEALDGQGRVIGGTCNYSTQESIELTHEAGDSIDGVLMVVPYYNNPPRKGSTATSGPSPRAPTSPASSTTSPAAPCATWRRRPPSAWPGTSPTSWASRRP